MTSKPIRLLYHKHCQDGTGALASAIKGLAKLGLSPKRIIGRIIGKDEEIELIEDVENSIIVYMDFCPKRSELELLAKKNVVVVLDHHDTSKRALEGVEDVINNIHELIQFANEKQRGLSAKFVMDKSGAGLSWDFFNPEEDRPRLINLIEDRDLWRFSYPESDGVSTLLHSREVDHLELCNLIDKTSTKIGMDSLISLAESVVQYRTTLLKEMARGFFRETVEGMNLTCEIVFCNSQCLHSDLGNYLLDEHPHARISVIFHSNPHHNFTKLSIRGRRGDSFAMKVAELLGGGGHPSASGARISSIDINQVIKTVTETSKVVLSREEKELEDSDKPF